MADGTGGPLMLADLNKVIQHNMNAEPDERMTGEIHVDSAGQRWPVYEKTEAIHGRRPMRDADGEIMYHLRPDGSRHRPMMESFVKDIAQQEFIKVPLGNGIVQRNFNFRESPEEIERRRLAKENERGIQELGQLLRSGGRTFADVVDAIKEKAGLQPRKEGAKEENPRTAALERFRELKNLAEEEGLEVKGTGKNGAVTLTDLEAAFVDHAAAAGQLNEPE